MARKKQQTKVSTATKRRKRRSPEEMIADLHRQIEEVKARAVAKSLKTSAAVKHTMVAVRNIDKGLEEAAEEDNKQLRHALADARKPLAAYLTNQGVRLPKARLPRGRKPK